MTEDNYIIMTHQIDEDTKIIANEFLRNLRLDKKSNHTIYKYKCIIQSYFIFIQKPLKELVPEDIFRWLTECHSNKKPRASSRG